MNRFIAAGNQEGEILIWRLVEIKYMDQPCALLEYKGHVRDLKFIQDSELKYNVLLSLHSDDNMIIITNLKDFKVVRKIPLPCESRMIEIHPYEYTILLSFGKKDKYDMCTIDLGFRKYYN